jgi:hypothetical protein
MGTLRFELSRINDPIVSCSWTTQATNLIIYHKNTTNTNTRIVINTIYERILKLLKI